MNSRGYLHVTCESYIVSVYGIFLFQQRPWYNVQRQTVSVAKDVNQRVSKIVNGCSALDDADPAGN